MTNTPILHRDCIPSLFATTSEVIVVCGDTRFLVLVWINHFNHADYRVSAIYRLAPGSLRRSRNISPYHAFYSHLCAVAVDYLKKEQPHATLPDRRR